MAFGLGALPRETVRTVGIVSGGHFLSHFFLMSLPPLFPLLVADFAVGNAQLGAIISMIYLSMFLFQIPAGELVDRAGGKSVFVLGVCLASAGVALIAFATSYYHLLAFALVAGVGQSAFHPADYALLDAVTDEDREGKSFGVHTFAGFVGFAAAPPVVGAIGVLADWRLALLVVGAAGLLYAVVAQVALRPVHRTRTLEPGDAAGADDGGVFGSVRLLRQPAILLLFTFFVVVTMADIGVQTFTAVYLVEALDFSEAAGNAALTAFLALTAIGVLVGGELADRYDNYWLIVGGLAVAAVGSAVTVTSVVAVRTVVAAAVWAAMGFSFGLVLPARDRVVNGLSSAADTGKSFGIVYTGLPLGGAVAPALVGTVIDAASPALGFGLNAVFFVLAAATILVFKLDALVPIRTGEQRGETT